jgi:hypothetical protein
MYAAVAAHDPGTGVRPGWALPHLDERARKPGEYILAGERILFAEEALRAVGPERSPRFASQ